MNWYDSAQAPAPPQPPPDVSRETSLAEAIAKMEAWMTERTAARQREREAERALAMDQRACTCEQCEDEACDGDCDPCRDRGCEQCRAQDDCSYAPCSGCGYCDECDGYH